MNIDVMAMNVVCMENVCWLCWQVMGQDQSNPFRAVWIVVCGFPSPAVSGDAEILPLWHAGVG